ncbi:MAG: hypothetical protein ACRC3B_21910 [Bacteroidia bacterium]
MSNNLISRYPVFENNQVLTSSQLNLLAGYLDEQTRITRTRLIGVGIVCGLEQSVTVNGTDATIHITEGKGVTSEGFLISIATQAYTRYKPYQLPSGVSYSPFMDQLSQVDLYELYPAVTTPAVSGTSTLTPSFINGNGPGTEKVVLLFLECTDIDLRSCLGRACDDLGMDRVFNLRALVAEASDVANFIQRQMLADNVTFPARFQMPDVRIRRPLFTQTGAESYDYFRFSENYINALRPVYDTTNLAPSIFDLISSSYTIFQPILQPVYGSNPVTLSSIAGYKTIWDSIITNSNATGPNYLGVQYFYDFMKDLLLAYNEFREAAADLMSRCCVSSAYFPKHLVLGYAQNDGAYSVMNYRTNFIASQTAVGQHDLQQRLVVLHKRMVLLLETFEASLVHSTTGNDDIRITPSIEKQNYLSPRAIPYYYNNDSVPVSVTLPAALNLTLESQWNYENLRRGVGSGTNFPVLSYNNYDINPGTGNYITKPLNFDLDPYNFLRIEGYLNKSYSQVLTDINTIKTNFNLPFNVMAVRLQGQLTAAEAKQLCAYADLDAQYRSLRAEMLARFTHWTSRAQNLFNFVQNAGGVGDFLDQLTREIGNSSNRASVLFSEQSITSALTAESSVANTSAQRSAGNQSQTSANNSASFVSSTAAVDQVVNSIQRPPLTAPRSLGTVISDFATVVGSTVGIQRYLNNLLTAPVMAERLSDFDFGYRPSAAGELIPIAAPTTPVTVDTSFILSYQALVAQSVNAKANLMLLLDEVSHSLNTRFTQEFYFSFGQWAAEQIWFLNSIISDQTYRAVEKVYYQYLHRLSYVMANDPTLLKNFVKRHPGIDHKAGVQPGGTFVVVYAGKDVTLLPQNIVSSANDSETATTSSNNMARTALPATTSANTPVARASALPVTVAAARAIGDFSLPYLVSCECFCDDIPSPTDAQLLQPSYAMTQFNDFRTSDFAYASDAFAIPTLPASNQATSPVLISLRRSVNYDETYSLRLYGITTQGTQTRNTFTTAAGGTVRIVESNGMEVFSYLPPSQIITSDFFDYVFETVDASVSLTTAKTRSNRARVVISVTEKFPVPVINQQTVQNNPLG